MSMEVSRGGMSQPTFSAQNASNHVSLPGGGQVAPVGGINGSILEETARLCASMRDAIAAADAGIRSCQVR